jgi:hypothetical protein
MRKEEEVDEDPPSKECGGQGEWTLTSILETNGR